jgi:hypothetical protein
MVKQFLRRMFAGRKNGEEREATPDYRENEWIGNAPEEEMVFVPEASPEAKDVEEVQDEPWTYMITRDKIEHHSYKQMTRMVEEILEQMELGLRKEGRLRLRLSPELLAETDDFFGKRIGKYIEGAERETYDATAFFDWADEETARIYRTYVLPAQPEKQQTFVQSRLVMIYDTCDALGWDSRRLAGIFAKAIGWELTEEDFNRFEQWLSAMSQRLEQEEEIPGGLYEQSEAQPEEDEFAHITPIQISREEVESEDITKLTAFFDSVLSNSEQIREKKGGLVFSFYGFSGELEDVMQDDAVNAWASRLVEQYPYVFYFLNDEYVPMTRFVTSMVVTSWMEGEEVVFNEEELEEFIHFIHSALARLVERTGEDPHYIIQEFDQKLFQA